MSSDEDMFRDSEPLILEESQLSGLPSGSKSSQSSVSQAESEYLPPEDSTQTCSSSSQVVS